MSVTGSSGALGATANPGKGIQSITRLAAGIYQLQLQDNYASYLDASFSIESFGQGSAVAATALSPNTVYAITSLGTTTQAQWVTAGVPSGITAAVGVVFKCAATSSGTGAGKAVAAANLYNIQVVGNPNLMLSKQPFQANSGGYVTFACIAPLTAGTAAADATPTITDPAAGTIITGSIWLNNSQVG